MKYETTPAFDADVGRLSRQEYELLGRVLRKRFVPAAERRAASQDLYRDYTIERNRYKKPLN